MERNIQDMFWCSASCCMHIVSNRILSELEMLAAQDCLGHCLALKTFDPELDESGCLRLCRNDINFNLQKCWICPVNSYCDKPGPSNPTRQVWPSDSLSCLFRACEVRSDAFSALAKCWLALETPRRLCSSSRAWSNTKHLNCTIALWHCAVIRCNDWTARHQLQHASQNA